MVTKKIGIAALPLMLAPLAVWAQSSVQVYGVVDLAVSSYYGAGQGSRHMLTSGGNQASRLGFKGHEDLGNGLTAGFDMEAGINADTGTGQATNTNNQADGSVGGGGLTFNRKAYVYMTSKSWGEIRLGRDYVPSFWNMFLYDPFRVGVGMSEHVVYGTTSTNFRASNSVGYFSPGCSSTGCKGVFFQAMVAFGENAAGPKRNDGNLAGARIGYGGSNWDVAFATTTTRNQEADDYRHTNLAGSYTWSGHKFMALLAQHRTGNRLARMDNANQVRYFQLGATWKVGQDSLPMSIMRLKRNDSADSSSYKFAIGYVHNLSKRTAVYGTYAHITNHGTLALPVASGGLRGPVPYAGGNASGFDIGLRHSF